MELSFDAVKKTNVIRAYYILPCCLLLLNLVNSIISYKAETIADPFTRTLVVILLVLFGSSVVAFAVAPALLTLVRIFYQRSKRGGGMLGEVLFLCVLGVVVFWLYYRLATGGPAALLPVDLRNGA